MTDPKIEDTDSSRRQSMPANIPDDVAEAVDILVSEYGVEEAEERLQAMFKDRHDRAVAALGYLRREYQEVTP